jgi:osmotically inducible lipoprotein OsmB
MILSVANPAPLAQSPNEKSCVHQRGIPMNAFPGITITAMAAIALLSLSACAGMSTQDQNTAIGAGVGAVGGAVLTGGSALGTVGGAAVGGVIGHEVSD